MADRLEVRAEEEPTLRRWARSTSIPDGLVRRAQIVLLAGDGVSNAEIARQVGVSRPTVITWRRRYLDGGIAAIDDRPRTHWYKWVDEAEIVVSTLEGPPEHLGVTHWTARLLGRELGLGHATIARVWAKWHLQPSRVESFRFSTQPALDAGIRDVVGLYIHPPQKAVVLCADEKPLPHGQAHDYVRHGTTTLVAALEAAAGRVTEICADRQQEFLAFLKEASAECPRLPLHLVVDNSIESRAVYKSPSVGAWLQRNPRVHLHFTLSSESWLDIVEISFGIVTLQAVRRGVSGSVRELAETARRFIDGWDEDCGPFAWTKTAPASPQCVVELVGGPLRGWRTVPTAKERPPKEARLLVTTQDGSTTYAVYAFTGWAGDGRTPVYDYSHSDVLDE